MSGVNDEALWEVNAGWWQEHFTGGVDPEYTEQIEPLARTWTQGFHRVLDLGCGEGQLSRLLADDGATVVGVDPTHAQVHAASELGGGPNYAIANAATLPFAAASYDAVLACLVFEHITTIDEAISEVARVLRPGGRFVFFLNHPLLQTPGSGWIDDQMIDPPEQYWRLGNYLMESETEEEVSKDVFIPFVHRPLSRYVNALAANELAIVHMDEPAPPPGFLARAAQYVAAAHIPRLLLLVAERRC